MENLNCELSEDEVSDGGLKIVIESPKRRTTKKSKVITTLNPEEKQIVQTIEEQFEQTLEEKAAKNNLSIFNVKKILKQVVTNEHVIEMVRQSENDGTNTEPTFEPKLTRAKAKQLLSSTTVSTLPWLTSNQPPSEVQKLISEDLAEDSSGDEYVPAEEESEDDRDSNTLSETEIRSVSPPIREKPQSPEVHWTDDGVFKIPPIKTKTIQDEEEEAANIALRTRSKLSLSSTPLEVIEEAFIPPDITTDMYDMDCDDDDWRDFLKKFTRPLDEITKATEDEDHDPEYNILADEDIDEVDTEELRADRAVTVTRRELNDLVAELFECTNAFSKTQEENNAPKIDLIVEPQVNVLQDFSLINNETNVENTNILDSVQQNNIPIIEPVQETFYNDVICTDQKLLLEQQMRQHIQLSTQNFLLTYEHPEYHNFALNFKEILINLKFLSETEEKSMFKPCNLEGALKLIEDWQNRFRLNTDEIRATKEFVCRVLKELTDSHLAGTMYIMKFPPLVMETISKSDVFLYPSLLPRNPFKSIQSLCNAATTFTNSEDQLIALGLEQFVPSLAQDPHHLTYNGEIKLKDVCFFINQYMLPTKTVSQLYRHIFNRKNPRSEMNSIKYYFENRSAPQTVHYVINIEEFGVLPPCKRDKELLPYQWKEYLHPESMIPTISTALLILPPHPLARVPKPPTYNKSFASKSSPKRLLAPKSTSYSSIRKRSGVCENSTPSTPSNSKRKNIFSSTPIQNGSFERTRKLENYFDSPTINPLLKTTTSRLQRFKFNSSIFKKFKTVTPSPQTTDKMLPSMPSLCSTKNDEEEDDVNVSSVCLSNTARLNEADSKPVEADSTIIDGEDEEALEKDNEDDINALMVASSTIKNLGRRVPSGAEKKRAKLRREYNATLTMLSPEDPTVIQEKAQRFAQAYFDKAHERLNPQDYERFMEVLNSFNERTSNVSELYKQIQEILDKKHPDLLDEFLTFLTPTQARDVGKLVPYYILNNMSLFLTKLEIYFKEQPAQLRKIYKSLTELAMCMNVTMEKVKNSILPLLKGNNLLTDWFLQIFPCEPPPESLLKGTWEQLDIRREADWSENIYESVTIPEAEDPFGGPNCSCSCHQGDDLLFKSRSQHCTPCGIKFVQGRVYVQTGKGLRLANVSFSENSSLDHIQRLNCSSSADKRKKRSATSPSKQLTSPTKDSQEEIRIANDSEDDGDCNRKRSRIPRSPRKKKIKLNEKLEKSPDDKPKTTEQSENCDKTTDEIVSNTNSVQSPGCKPLEDNQNKPASDELTEWDCNASIESAELRLSPEHSAESESEFCEESSQDNINTETDDSVEELESLSNSPVHSENSNSNTFEEASWTRDEDKIILETMQKEGDKEEAFIRISEVLGNRSVVRIKERFSTLMNLLQKMASSSNKEF